MKNVQTVFESKSLNICKLDLGEGEWRRFSVFQFCTQIISIWLQKIITYNSMDYLLYISASQLDLS